MPYFSDINHSLEKVLLWADLRHEQGCDVAPALGKLRTALDEAHRTLEERTGPNAAALKREPNALDSIRAQRPDGPRRLTLPHSDDVLLARLTGAWLGRAAGCTLGVPVEAWSPDAMEALARRCGMEFPPTDYWADHPQWDQVRYASSTTRDYLKGRITAVPVDDDLTYTLLGLLILEEYGLDFTTADVAAAWLRYLPIACTAEDIALKNLKAGVPPELAGVKNNPYQEWIGADIRSDPWAYAAPGNPERAAAMAYQDAYLTHRHNGIYGSMYFAAAISAAFVVDCPMEALRIGLTEIPQNCRLAGDVRWALDAAPTLADWRAARAAVDARFPGMHVVHTNNNACLTIFGLHLGQRDFTRTIGITVAMGLDNDCTGATAGSILGAILGSDGIPEHWWKPFNDKARCYLVGQEWWTNSDIAGRFLALAKAGRK